MARFSWLFVAILFAACEGVVGTLPPLLDAGASSATELVWQLRGQAGPRQVDGARLALQHNLGLGGAAALLVI